MRILIGVNILVIAAGITLLFTIPDDGANRVTATEKPTDESATTMVEMLVHESEPVETSTEVVEATEAEATETPEPTEAEAPEPELELQLLVYAIMDTELVSEEGEVLQELRKGETAEVNWMNDEKMRASTDGAEGFLQIAAVQIAEGMVAVVDISDQYLRLYQDGQKILETPVITGKSGVTDTRIGVHTITQKQEHKALNGGKHSDYWLRFSRGQGLHDAYWRTPEEYTPERYLAHGSGGCVNTPYEAMETIYGLMDVDDLVIVQR